MRQKQTWPVAIPLVGVLLLWLSAWPLNVLRTEVASLPHEPSFTLSHLLLLVGAVVLTLGAAAIAVRACRGRPYEAVANRKNLKDPIGGAVACALGLALLLGVWLVLSGAVSPPGWLMGDRIGRISYLALPLLLRGAVLSVSPLMASSASRYLLNLNLVIFWLCLFAFWHRPYSLIDGQFFAAQPGWMALPLSLLIAVTAAGIHCHGVRAPTGGSPTAILAGILCLPLLLGPWLDPLPERKSLPSAALRLDIVDPLERSFWLGADWMLRDQNPDGSFRYIYRLDKDAYGGQENIVRQAGAAYSMAYICSYSRREEHCRAAGRSMNYLVSQLRSDGTGSFVMHNGRATLGGTALALVALAHYRLATGTDTYEATMSAMTDHVISQQLDNGSFDGHHKQYWIFGKDQHESVSSGEAMYALALIHRLTGRPDCREAYDRAEPFYLDYWETTHDTNLFAWAVKAGYHMFLATGDPRYARLSWQMSAWMAARQNRDAASPGYGSYFPVTSISSATYTEGIGDALYLAAALQELSFVNDFRETLRLAAGAVARLQIGPDMAETGPRPLRSLGAFTSLVGQTETRIDHTQHALAAILRELKWNRGDYDLEPDGVAIHSSPLGG